MLPAPFCSTLLSLQLGKKSDKNIYNEREKKWNCGETVCLVFYPFFLFVCIFLFFFWIFFFFLSYCFFLFFFIYFFRLRTQRTVPNDEQQTNKQTKKIIIQSYQLALHSLREVFFLGRGEMEWRVIVQKTVGWTQKGGKGGGGRRSIKFMREGWKFKKVSRRQRMAAQLTVQ